jgi:DNA-binding MarR family transcriptional regulator
VNDVSTPAQAPPVQATPRSEQAKAEAAELLTAIGAVRRVARRAVRTSSQAEPLPPARSELLRLAARRPGIGVAEAAAELRLAPNSVSTMVSKLTEDGLLSRDRGASDGRSVRLTVTEAGAARIEQWRDIRADLAGRALERLPQADREALAAAIPALARLAEHMELLLPGGTTTRCAHDGRNRQATGRVVTPRGDPRTPEARP